MTLNISERNLFARFPALGPLTITDAALEALVVALSQRHGRLDNTAQYVDDWTSRQVRHARMITALARILQALLADYDGAVTEELLDDSESL